MTYINGPSMVEYRDRYSGRPFGALPDPEELACAAHEAAHAVVAAGIGHRVDFVEIEHTAHGGYSWQGQCSHAGDAGRSMIERAVEASIVAIAPFAARDALEGIVRQYEPAGGLFVSDERTMQAALSVLESASPAEHRAECMDTARLLLAAHATTWRSVTYALIRRGTLDADDLAAIDPDLFSAEDPEPEPIRSRPPLAPAPSAAPYYRAGGRRVTTRDVIPGLEYRTGGLITLNEGRRS